MTDRELNIALREMARGAGLCDEWYGEWSDEDSIDECLDRYVRGFDFAVKNNYPPLDFIRRNFDIKDLHRHNIYIDEDVEIHNAENGYYVFLGGCVAKVRCSGFRAVTIYCRHDTIVDVTASDGARVFVTYYDQSRGGCVSDEFSKIRKYKK